MSPSRHYLYAVFKATGVFFKPFQTRFFCSATISSANLFTEMALTVTLVRHGETHENLKRQIQGRTDTFLSATGLQQAEDLGKYLHSSNVKFSRAISSPLKRAFKTAELALIHSKHELSITTDDRLQERCFGEAEGRFTPEVFEEAREAGLPFHLYNPPGAETLEEVMARAQMFFEDLCASMDTSSNEDNHVLVVSHGGWISALMRYLYKQARNVKLNQFDESKALRIPRNTAFHRFIIRKDVNTNSGYDVEFLVIGEIRHTETNVMELEKFPGGQ